MIKKGVLLIVFVLVFSSLGYAITVSHPADNIRAKVFGAVNLIGQGRSPLLIVSYPEDFVIENVCQSIERLPTKEGRSVIDCER